MKGLVLFLFKPYSPNIRYHLGICSITWCWIYFLYFSSTFFDVISLHHLMYEGYLKDLFSISLQHSLMLYIYISSVSLVSPRSHEASLIFYGSTLFFIRLIKRLRMVLYSFLKIILNLQINIFQFYFKIFINNYLYSYLIILLLITIKLISI